MEKPLTVDGPTSRKMLKLAEEATAKNLKVGVGLMSRHNRGMEELAKRIQDGEIGDLVLHARLPHAWPGRSLSRRSRPAERIAVADPELPQLPVGQRRLFQRLLHPHH